MGHQWRLEAPSLVPYSPASKLNQATSFWKTLGNIYSMPFKCFNLSIGEIILIQKSDFLKELQPSFCLQMS